MNSDSKPHFFDTKYLYLLYQYIFFIRLKEGGIPINGKTKKLIIIFEITLLTLASLFTVTILFSNYNQENNSNNTESINPIDVDIEGAVSEGKSPYKIAFSAKTTNGNKPLTYQWEFGDGSISTDQNPTHTFKKTGLYQTRLTVSDSYGNTGLDIITINIEEITPLEAKIGVNTWSGFQPLIVYFYGDTNNGFANMTYEWEFGPKNRLIIPMSEYQYPKFGDGFGFRRRYNNWQNRQYNSQEQDPIMVFYDEGLYWAKLKVTDENGNTDTEMLWLQVYDIDIRTTVFNNILNKNDN